MKFKGLEKDIENSLNVIRTTKDKDGLRGQIAAQFEGDYEKAVLMTLRGNGVNMTEFFKVALWEYEHILERIISLHTPFVLDLIKDNETEAEEV